DGFASGSERTKPNEIRNVTLKPTRERQVNPANRFLRFKQRVARCRNDTDDFHALFLFAVNIGARSTLLVRILDTLSKRITDRPEFLCQNFVNYRDLWTGLGRLRFSEPATPSHRQSNGQKIIRADAVPSHLEGKAFGRGRRLRV